MPGFHGLDLAPKDSIPQLPGTLAAVGSQPYLAPGIALTPSPPSLGGDVVLSAPACCSPAARTFPVMLWDENQKGHAWAEGSQALRGEGKAVITRYMEPDGSCLVLLTP